MSYYCVRGKSLRQQLGMHFIVRTQSSGSQLILPDRDQGLQNFLVFLELSHHISDSPSLDSLAMAIWPHRQQAFYKPKRSARYDLTPWLNSAIFDFPYRWNSFEVCHSFVLCFAALILETWCIRQRYTRTLFPVETWRSVEVFTSWRPNNRCIVPKMWPSRFEDHYSSMG